MVSIGADGHHDHPTGDPRALASGRLPPVLRWKSRSLKGRPRAGKIRCGVRRAFMVICSSSALRSLSRRSPSIWPGDVTSPLRASAQPFPHIAAMICSWFRPSAFTCSLPWSSSGWPERPNLSLWYTQLQGHRRSHRYSWPDASLAIRS